MLPSSLSSLTSCHLCLLHSSLSFYLLHLLLSSLSPLCPPWTESLCIYVCRWRSDLSGLWRLLCSALPAPLPLLYVQTRVLNLASVNYVYYVVGRALIGSCSVHAQLDNCHVSAGDCFVIRGKYVTGVCTNEVDMFTCTFGTMLPPAAIAPTVFSVGSRVCVTLHR